MNNFSRTPGAQINPLIAIALALIALLAVVLIFSPPRVVDSPQTPTTPPSVNETPTDESNNQSGEDNGTGNEDTSQNDNNTSENASSDCATAADLNRDGTWRAQMDSDTRALLEQVLAALGGLEKLNSLCTLHGKGESELTAQGQSIDSQVELWIRMPNQVRNLVKVPLPIPGQFIETLIILEGSEGWMKALNPETFQVEITELTEDLRVQAIEEISLHPLLSLLAIQDAQARFSYIGTDHPANKGIHAVEFRSSLGSSGIFFYDPETLRTHSLYREGGGRTVEKIYDDYRTVSGFSIPHTIRTILTDPEIGEFSTSLTYETIEVNSELEPALFTEPTL